jgi:hypothetical protein
MGAYMKKRYLFVAAAILAVVITGCDLFDPGSGIGAGETYGDLTITGVSTENKSVKTIFSTTRGSGGAAMTMPETGDTYRIVYDNKDVSKGSVEVRANIVTFKPSSGASFDAILGSSDNQTTLNFLRGITASDGTNIGYVNFTAINPVLDTDLDNSVTLAVGQTRSLAVIVKPGSGGTPSYQWYKAGSTNDPGTPIQGANGVSYTVSGTAPATAFYYVMVTNASGGFKTSNVVRVQVGSAINIVAGGSGTPLPSLPDVIRAMFGSTPEMPYTVTFAEDPQKMLFISDTTFPGTGKVTINATVPLTKGIHITRSNVELNGLNILITDTKGNPLIGNDCCAVLISKRYANYIGADDMAFGTLDEPDYEIKTNMVYWLWKDYNDFSPKKTINNVEIVNCNISFVVSGNAYFIDGIFVDSYTSGRETANRVKIKNTVVNTAGNINAGAYCFYGNNADLSDNIFTSTNRFGVVGIHCIFDLFYAGSKDTISFTNNQLNASKFNRLALLTANAWWYDKNDEDNSVKDYNSRIVTIGNTSFGKRDPDKSNFSDLQPRYQKLIKDLFAQAPITDERYVTLVDESINGENNASPENFEDYIKDGDTYKMKPKE